MADVVLECPIKILRGHLGAAMRQSPQFGVVTQQTRQHGGKFAIEDELAAFLHAGIVQTG